MKNANAQNEGIDVKIIQWSSGLRLRVPSTAIIENSKRRLHFCGHLRRGYYRYFEVFDGLADTPTISQEKFVQALKTITRVG